MIKRKYIRRGIYSGLAKVAFPFMLSLLLLLAHDRVKAQDGLKVIRGEGIFSNNSWIHFSDASNALYHHLAGQAYDLLDKRAWTTAGLRTLGNWQARQQRLRESLREAVGPFPEKTPLNAQVVRIIDKEGYRVEHIIYESQPGFYVTSSLFIPDGIKAKAPAVIYTSGHTKDAYRDIAYQHMILNLVKKGFIVFAFDPVGQGERLEYYDPESGKSVLAVSTGEHTYSGSQTFITGGSQARYMMWDGIRAVDYLLSREEVDPERIGITGMSGGGTQSAHIAALDGRIHAAAPSNYLTSFTRLLESIGPQDAEQTLPSGIKRGIDHADLLAVRAPKPALMLTTTRDAFSIQGARETAREISRIYKAYGKEENFGMVEDDAGHVVTPKNREAMYGFFQQHLNNPGSPADQETEPLSEQEMQITSTGQVATSLGGETVFSLNRKEAKKRIYELEASRQDLPRHLPRVLESARKLSGYQEPEEVDEPVFTGRLQRDGYVIEKYFVKGEGNYPIPYLLMVPDKPTNKALIYLHPSGKAAEASAGGEMEWFARRGFTVLAPDMIGIGEVGVGSDNTLRRLREWRVSMLIGRSIVGVQAGDVARLTRLLENKHMTDEVYGVARKEMGPVLLYAAAFDPAIKRIALIEPYSSYRSIVMNRFYNPGFIHSTVPGALKAYDLPDLAASLVPRKLVMAGVTDGFGETTDTESIMEDLSFIKTAYKAKKADGQLIIIARESLEKPYDLFIEFIK
jgi:cephalosporin-C deacetylase-like acetyl esterase